MNPSKIYRIDLEPIGRRAEIAADETLLDAARAAGVELVTLCGGEGWCYGCVVQVLTGNLNPPTAAEREALSDQELAAGFRLACQARPLRDIKLNIPPESLAAQQRLQVEGQETTVRPDPLVVPVDLNIAEPTLDDPRSDTTRVAHALIAAGHAPPVFPHAILTGLAGRLRTQHWTARLGLRGGEVVAVLPAATPLLGLAVDIGTTKLAAYLVELETGRTVAKTGAMNPQIAYGEDVVSRISYTLEHTDGRTTLQARLVDTLNHLVAALCEEAGASRGQVCEAVVVGNTVMHHLFAGLPVAQLGRAPYVPAVSEPLDLRARDVGLELAPGAYVHLPPNIAGYVGADHVAMALATEVLETDRTLVALDIGTNTEVSVTRGGRIWSCSCASGPAFEGAHIRDGMRAAPGAIERVQIIDGRVHLKTIGNQPPVGICGSGILDAVSEMLRSGIIDRRGALQAEMPGVSMGDGLLLFTLATPAVTAHERPIVVTRKDINEIQLAKAAIRTGVEILLAEAGVSHDEIEAFIVAGAFGAYIDVVSAIRTGMFPNLPMERFQQVGNAAGAGARQMLVSAERRAAAAAGARRVQYVELTVHPQFTQRYMKALYF